MSNQQPKALALNAGWTDAPVTLTNSGNEKLFASLQNANNTNIADSATLTVGGTGFANATATYHGWWYNDYWYPYYRPLYINNSRPIRLTMAEVERLRVAAKKDKVLKETLEKFTDHIEVIVDFGK